MHFRVFGRVLVVELLHQQLLIAELIFKLVTLGEIVHDLRDLVLLYLVVVLFFEGSHFLFVFGVHLFNLFSEVDALLGLFDHGPLLPHAQVLILLFELFVDVSYLRESLLLLVEHHETLIVLLLDVLVILLGLDKLLNFDIQVIVDALEAVDF